MNEIKKNDNPQIETQPISEKEKKKREWEEKINQAQSEFERKREQFYNNRPQSFYKCFGWCKRKHSSQICPRCLEIFWKWFIIILLLVLAIIFLIIYFWPQN